MKNSKLIRCTLIFSLCCAALTARVNAQAQTSTNASPTQQFWDTALGYFSSFNTTTFTATNWHGNIWAGADYQSGVNVASSLGLEYGIYKSLSLESVTRNENTATGSACAAGERDTCARCPGTAPGPSC